jgi:hypothetical protein
MKKNKNNIIIVLFFAVIIFLAFFFYMYVINTVEPFVELPPKKIWTFWDSEKLPLVVQKCIDTWRKHNPDYEITVINKNNISNYTDANILGMKHMESPPRLSDMVRLHVLDKHGGFWMDATIICHKSLEWIREKNVDFFGYYLDGFTLPEFVETSPVIESWFFACVPNSSLVNDWKNEFLEIQKYDNIDVCDYIK